MRTLAVVAVTMTVAVGCGGGGLDRDAEAELLATDYGISVDEGRCVIDLVVDEMGDERFEAVVEGGDATPDEIGLLADSLAACDADAAALFAVGDVTDIAASFGFSENEARCVIELAVERLGAERLAELGRLAAASPDGPEQEILLDVVSECTE